MLSNNISLSIGECFSIIFLYWFVYMISLLCFYIIITYFVKNNKIGVYILACYKKHSNIFFILVVSLVSLAGFPPFLGFWAKMLLLLYITKYGDLFIIFIFWFILFFSIVFYLKMLQYCYGWNYEYSSVDSNISRRHGVVIFCFVFLLCCGLFFFNDLLLFSLYLFI